MKEEGYKKWLKQPKEEGYKKWLKNSDLPLHHDKNTSFDIFRMDKHPDYNLIIEKKNDDSVFAYIKKDGYGLIQDCWGSTLSESTYESWLKLVLDNIDKDIEHYESVCNG